MVDSLKDKCSFNRKLRTSSNLGEKTQISTMRFVASSTVATTILKNIENRPKTQGFKFYFQPFMNLQGCPPSAGLGHWESCTAAQKWHGKSHAYIVAWLRLWTINIGYTTLGVYLSQLETETQCSKVKRYYQ